jgi:hypothetical protein
MLALHLCSLAGMSYIDQLERIYLLGAAAVGNLLVYLLER